MTNILGLLCTLYNGMHYSINCYYCAYVAEIIYICCALSTDFYFGV